ncbi:MAG: polysaccharide deacetylase family protein [bacterium]
MKKIVKCFPEGKYKVLTLSYDDGTEADKKLVNIFNKYNLKATFHLNSGLTVRENRIGEAEIKEVYQGHEVAAHTLNHPTIERCPEHQVINEIMTDRKNLEQIVGYPVRGLSYPNGSYNEKIKNLLPSLGIEYARIVGNSNNFAFPDDLYEWQATCHHNHNLMDLAQEFIDFHKQQYLYLFYVWGHSFEFDRDNNWDLIEEFSQFIGGQDDVWYATNIEIVDYLKAVERLQFSASGDFVYNPSVTDVWLIVEGNLRKIKAGQQTILK